jgi:IS30 family transposase
MSHKQLANIYGVHPQTLTRELRRIRTLKIRPFTKMYSPEQLKIIFSTLGNPI